MFSRLFGRLPAGQARHIDHARRQIVSGQLTGPVTFTVVSTISSPSSTSSSSSVRPTITVTTTVRSSSRVVSTTTSSTSSTPTQSLETSSVPSSTNSLPVVTGSPVVMEGDNKGSSHGRDSGPKQGGLPAGAIAGIVITVLLALAALIVFLVRKRMASNRQNRSRGWKDNMFSKGISSEKYNGGVAGYGREEGLGGTVTPYEFSAQPQPQPQHKSSPSKSIPRVPVPAMPTTSYNNPPTAGIVPTPTGEWPQRSPAVVNGATVVSTFIPSLPDEMSISMGETVRVLAEYDDGWVLCQNGRGEQGMVPLECLGQDNSTQQAYVARDPSVARRASSLTGSGSVRRM